MHKPISSGTRLCAPELTKRVTARDYILICELELIVREHLAERAVSQCEYIEQ